MRVVRKEVDVRGRRVRYLAAGEGPPLVLLHGIGETTVDWHQVLPLLSRKHFILAPELFWRDGSPEASEDYTPVGFQELLLAFLEALEVDRAVLVGHSFGGAIAARVAMAAPGRVRKLVLVDSVGLGNEVHPALRLLAMPMVGEIAVAWSRTPAGRSQRRWLRQRLLFEHPERGPRSWITEQERLASRSGVLERALVSLRSVVDIRGQRDVLLDRMSDLKQPTLIVWGRSDRVLPVTQARKAVSRLQRGQLAILEQCGHMPPVEQPEACGRLIVEFSDERT